MSSGPIALCPSGSVGLSGFIFVKDPSGFAVAVTLVAEAASARDAALMTVSCLRVYNWHKNKNKTPEKSLGKV